MTTMPEGSPFWQNAFLIAVFVYLLYSVWQGWRKGVARATMGLFGIVAGYLVGFAVAPSGGAVLGGIVPLPNLLLGVLLGAIAGFGTYVAIALLGAVLFKRTDQQSSPLLRFGFGAGGGLIGLVFGLVILWGLVVFLRGVGALAAGEVEASAARPAADARKPSEMMVEFSEIKRSIESGATGQWVESLDVMPEQTYRILEKIGHVLASRAAMERLLEYPPVQDVVGHPKFVALTSDPDVNDLAQKKDLAAMVSNPKVIAAANDPDLIEKLKKVDMEKALDHALAAPPPAVEPQ